MRNMINYSLLFAVAALFIASGFATGDTVVLREGLDGYSGTTDVYIYRSAPTSNVSYTSYASRRAIDVWGSPFPPGYLTTKGGGTDWNEGLLKFDNIFDSIDPMSIDSATLTLQIVNPYEKPYISRMTTPWTGATASWDYFDVSGSGDHPSAGGGITTGVNTLAAPDYSSASTLSGSVDIDVTAAVQAWFADPSSNQGWAFFKDAEPNRGMFVASEEPTYLTERPTLTIEFTRVPEPGTIFLLGIGAAGLLAVSRRLRKRT